MAPWGRCRDHSGSGLLRWAFYVFFSGRELATPLPPCEAIIARTPASIGPGLRPLSFAVADTGGDPTPGLVDSGRSRVRALYADLPARPDGNLADTRDHDLASCTSAGVSVLAFDYAGMARAFSPIQARLLAAGREWALSIFDGDPALDEHRDCNAEGGLGANLALEVVAAAHPGPGWSGAGAPRSTRR